MLVIKIYLIKKDNYDLLIWNAIDRRVDSNKAVPEPIWTDANSPQY